MRVSKKIAVLFLFAAISHFSIALADDDPAAEIQKDQKPYQDQINQLNRYNPFFSGSETQKFFQENVHFSPPPALGQAMDLVTKSPNRTTLLYVEIGWALAMMILRIWLYSRSKSWVQRFLHGIANTIMYWAFASFLIPWLILGEPYLALWKSLLH